MSRRQPTVPLRALVIISIVALTVLLLASAGLASGGNRDSADVVVEQEATTVEYQVRSGDTLWSIADREVGIDGDRRSFIDEIRRLNDLDDSMIRTGQRLALPTT